IGRVKRDGMAADGDSESGSVCFAGYLDSPERPAESAACGERTGDSLENTKVGVSEGKDAIERRLGRSVHRPRAKVTLHMDVTGRNGVREHGLERHCGVERDRLHVQLVYFPDFWRLFRHLRDDDKARLGRGQILDDNVPGATKPALEGPTAGALLTAIGGLDPI